jgi:hypothetical protein
MSRPPAFPARLLSQTAVVKGEGVGGGYTVTLVAALPCLLGIASSSGAKTATERADLAQTRTMVWTQAYAMPDAAQVVIGAETYNVIPGSYQAPIWPFDGSVLYRCVDLIRVK